MGYCGQFLCSDGKIVPRYQEEAVASWYHDPIPTNCVANWVCPVSKMTSGGKPLNNLAIFYGSCNLDCFFCQNHSYKEMTVAGEPRFTPIELTDAANQYTTCVCFFGGDPSCNAQHSIKTAEAILKKRNIKICYETNGHLSSKWLKKTADIVIQSEGIIKFDLKAFTPSIYTALTGGDNRLVLRNFRKLAQLIDRAHDAFLVASILLVPGYIDSAEIRSLCEFIASCDPRIPTALLGFAPHFQMRDLPRTSRAHAQRAEEIAREVGLENIEIGNLGLLSDAVYHIG